MIVHEHFPLSTILYYRIGGTARYLLEARSPSEVEEALEFVRTRGIGRYLIVGLGSNLLFPDGPFDGAVIQIAASSERRQISESTLGRITSFAGETLDNLIQTAFGLGYTGLEWAGGLPGTVGAAVRGNVGAFGGEMRDVLESAQLLDTAVPGGDIRPYTSAELRFSYRNSLVKESRRLVVLSATVALRFARGEELEAAQGSYSANIDYRERNHPLEYPTCGSVFKNVAGSADIERVLAAWPDAEELVRGRWHGKVSMGYIINRLGLRGYQVGGAQVSTKHSNFIVNLGDARASDVATIIETVQGRCLSTLGFVPEAEVEMVKTAS